MTFGQEIVACQNYTLQSASMPSYLLLKKKLIINCCICIFKKNKLINYLIFSGRNMLMFVMFFDLAIFLFSSTLMQLFDDLNDFCVVCLHSILLQVKAFC